MKKTTVFGVLFMACCAGVFGQSKPHSVSSVGIDVAKNVPYLFFPTFFGGKNALIVEPTLQLTTLKPNQFINLTLGYTQIDQERDNNGRTVHFLKGFHAQVMHEIQSTDGQVFWAYGGMIALGYGKGAIQIKGDFFPTYLAPLPAFSGAGAGLKIQAGVYSKVAKRWRLRSSVNLGLNAFDYGAANPAYLPGAGPFWGLNARNFAQTAGLNLQVFYLTK